MSIEEAVRKAAEEVIVATTDKALEKNPDFPAWIEMKTAIIEGIILRNVIPAFRDK